jgi:hypothetical protein
MYTLNDLSANMDSIFNSESVVIDALNKGKYEYGYGSMMLWEDNANKGVHFLLNEKNLEKAKEAFYLSGRMSYVQNQDTEYIKKDFQSEFTFICPPDWSLILVSDCKELIETFSKMRYKNYEKDLKKGENILAVCMQCALLNEKDKLIECLPIFEKVIKQMKTLKFDREFFIGFLERDKEKMEYAIKELLMPKVHSSRNQYSLQKEFLSYPSLGYAKLAWIKGFEVEINNPLVPKELLPIKPLKKYEDTYEFLKIFPQLG